MQVGTKVTINGRRGTYEVVEVDEKSARVKWASENGTPEPSGGGGPDEVIPLEEIKEA